MKNTTAIEVKSISKHFIKKSESNKDELFFALKDVSFKVDKGDIIGIIGHNGSGKSTLLRILSGILKPDNGNVIIDGTIASILDIGAGMHPELTGKENIYLKGELLGMTQKEIDDSYTKILAFSEIEPFIYTPVKNYSNGMFLRLAFSSLLFLKADILIMDEVLGVGDNNFVEKAQNYLKNSLMSNKTIVMVSHNMSEIRMCNKFIVLNQGKIETISTNSDTIDNYLLSLKKIAKIHSKNIVINDFSSKSNFIKLNMLSMYQDSDEFVTNRPFIISFEYQKPATSFNVNLILNFTDIEGKTIMISSSFVDGKVEDNKAAGTYIENCNIFENIFHTQVYSITVYFTTISALNIDKHVEQFSDNNQDVLAVYDKIFYFKPVYKFNNKSIDLSSLKLNAKLLLGFNWTFKKL